MYSVHDLAWDGRQYQPRDFASRLRSSKYLLCNSKHCRLDHQIMYTAAEEMIDHFINMRFILYYNIKNFLRELRFQLLSQRKSELSTNPDPYNMFWGFVKIRRCIQYIDLTVEKYDWIDLTVWQPKMVLNVFERTKKRSSKVENLT